MGFWLGIHGIGKKTGKLMGIFSWDLSNKKWWFNGIKWTLMGYNGHQWDNYLVIQ
jgi:hypothetical protein